MKLEWLLAWWEQIRGSPPGDPWNEDPEITRERRRQHREGVTDRATAYWGLQDMRRRRIDTQVEAWQRENRDG